MTNLKVCTHACLLCILCAVTAIPSTAQTFTVIASRLGIAEGGLTFDSAGNLYGATANGGTGGWVGTIFELSPNSDGTWTDTELFDFADLNAAGPQGPLIFDSAGNLYGTTVGADTVQNIAYELSPTSSGWAGTVLSTLGSYSAVSPSKLIFDAAGNLYGTTGTGGLHCMFNGTGCGTVFRLSPLPGGGWQKTDLYHFKDKGDGAIPGGGLVMDSAANLYGTASLGGIETGICLPNGGYPGCGVVFKLSPTPLEGPWKETVLYRFTGAGDGGIPLGGLIFDSAGNLYGTTAGGGVNNLAAGYGVVFKLSPTASGPWKERVLYPFLGENENDGYSPEQTLVFDTAGNLYGTTYFGGGHANCQGTDTCGIAFKLTPRKSGYWAEHILHRFDGGAGGAGQPTGPLILDSAGNLYGTTIGTAFKITP